MSEPRQLSGLDSFFLYAETPRTPMEVSSLSIYDPSTAPGGKVRFKEILAVFAERLERARVFTRKLRPVPLSLDHPYWVDDPDFDIEHHVRHIALPKPGDWRQLMIQVSRLQSFQLDHDRPLWEAYVIEGLDHIEGLKPGCFAIFMKMHHSTVDGASGIALQRAIHDFEPLAVDVSSYEPRRRRAKMPPPQDWTLLRRVPLNTVRKTLKLATGLALAAPGLAKAALARRGKPKQGIPRTLFNQGRASAGRVVDARIFSLDEVKAIARAAGGTTVNDVVLGVVGGAMRRYLEARGRLPEQSLVAGVPINVRGDGHEGHDNMVSMMAAPLCTDIADPVERLHAIHAGTREAKSVTETVGARTLTQVPMHLPAPVARTVMPLLSELAVRTGTIQFNTIVSNVPGVQQPIYLAGAQMMVMLGMGPVVDQAGIFHAVFSYNGTISFTITACREMLPDPEVYSQCLEDAYLELRAAVFDDLVAATARAAPPAAGEAAAVRTVARRKAARSKPAPGKAKARTEKQAAGNATQTAATPDEATSTRDAPGDDGAGGPAREPRDAGGAAVEAAEAKEAAAGEAATRAPAGEKAAVEKAPGKKVPRKKATRKKTTKKKAARKKATNRKAATGKPANREATKKAAGKAEAGEAAAGKATKKKAGKARAAANKASGKRGAGEAGGGRTLVRRTASSTPAPDLEATPTDAPPAASRAAPEGGSPRRKGTRRKAGKKLVRRVGGDD